MYANRIALQDLIGTPELDAMTIDRDGRPFGSGLPDDVQGELNARYDAEPELSSEELDFLAARVEAEQQGGRVVFELSRPDGSRTYESALTPEAAARKPRQRGWAMPGQILSVLAVHGPTAAEPVPAQLLGGAARHCQTTAA